MARKRISRRRNSKKYRTVKRHSKWRQLKTRSHTMRVKGGRKRRKNRKMNKSRKILKGGAQGPTLLFNKIEGHLNETPTEEMLIPKEVDGLVYGMVQKKGSGFSLRTWTDRLFIYSISAKVIQYYDPITHNIKGTFKIKKVKENSNSNSAFSFDLIGTKTKDSGVQGIDPPEATLSCKVTSDIAKNKWLNFFSQNERHYVQPETRQVTLPPTSSPEAAIQNSV